MGDTDIVIESRYIKTGAKTLPPLEVLEHTSKNIRDHVGALLQKRGVRICTGLFHTRCEVAHFPAQFGHACEGS
jgi:hypothetical protein